MLLTLSRIITGSVALVALAACSGTGTPVPALPAPAATTPSTASPGSIAGSAIATAVSALPRPSPTRSSTKPAVRRTSTPTRRATTRPRPRPTTSPAPARRIVTPGAYCPTEGATGFTAKGTAMRCTRKPGEPRPRWRAL